MSKTGIIAFFVEPPDYKQKTWGLINLLIHYKLTARQKHVRNIVPDMSIKLYMKIADKLGYELILKKKQLGNKKQNA